METTILLKDETLWSRIQNFSLDAPDSDFPFSKKLAKEENWTLEFAQKAIQEYKKFVYLCCVLPNGASPSETVDKVWHMHLIYTQSYWEEFCPNILKRKLHHHPSKGGVKEKTKHQNWFSDTLRSYREIFQQEAPKDIWYEKKSPIIKRMWLKRLRIAPLLMVLFLLSSCLGDVFSTLGTIIASFAGMMGFALSLLFSRNNGDIARKKKDESSIGGSGDGGGSSCSSNGGGSGCSSGCGGGCGGCGGGCGG